MCCFICYQMYYWFVSVFNFVQYDIIMLLPLELIFMYKYHKKYWDNVIFEGRAFNLFTTSDPLKIWIPILQIFVFIYWRGTRKHFVLVENIFWTNRKMFSCPPSITKTKIWRIGIRIFGGSDVVNKLLHVPHYNDTLGLDILTPLIHFVLCSSM